MSEELETVDEENWTDLRVGDRALVKGKTKFKHGDTCIMVNQPNWVPVLIDITDVGGAQTDGKSFQTSPVTVTVERTEDGLCAATNDIIFTG